LASDAIQVFRSEIFRVAFDETGDPFRECLAIPHRRASACPRTMSTLLWITDAHLEHLSATIAQAWFEKLQSTRADMLLLGGDTANSMHA
jgi:hypothetical protein